MMAWACKCASWPRELGWALQTEVDEARWNRWTSGGIANQMIREKWTTEGATLCHVQVLEVPSGAEGCHVCISCEKSDLRGLAPLAAPFKSRLASMPTGRALSLRSAMRAVTCLWSFRPPALPQGGGKSVLEALVVANNFHSGNGKALKVGCHERVFVGPSGRTFGGACAKVVSVDQAGAANCSCCALDGNERHHLCETGYCPAQGQGLVGV